MELAQHGIPLISGFAKGIDSYTQAACINHGGYTALFLAGGVDICYPLEQQSLYFKTLENGGFFFLNSRLEQNRIQNNFLEEMPLLVLGLPNSLW